MLHDVGSTAALSKWPLLFCGLVEGALDIDGSGDECGMNLSSALHEEDNFQLLKLKGGVAPTSNTINVFAISTPTAGPARTLCRGRHSYLSSLVPSYMGIRTLDVVLL